MDDLRDWTGGQARLKFQNCRACNERWYFERGFCPHCGSGDVETRESHGLGLVYATTVVVRAPSLEWRDLAPYGLALIDLDENVRVMTHAQLGLEINDRVRIEFVQIGHGLIPFARPSAESLNGEQP
jgi:uncharacterized OB-fold protein